jgi:hypothetical protein
MGELQPVHANLVRGQAIEHERVIGIWAVRNRNFTSPRRCVCNGLTAGCHIDEMLAPVRLIPRTGRNFEP